MVSSILKVGDKIDIRILQEVENARRTGEKPKTWRSVICDIKDDGLLEIAMPTEGGKLVLLALGIRYELTFHAEAGLYQCIAQVKERYKNNNMYMVTMELRTNLSKFQRREYYRKDVLLDVDYMEITPEEAANASAEEAFMQHVEDSPRDRLRHATALDISGGGMRMVTDRPVESENVVLNILLENDEGERSVWLHGSVLQSKRTDSKNGLEQYENRVVFDAKDEQLRELIIKYIFEEERRDRNV